MDSDKYEGNLHVKSIFRQFYQHYFAEKLIFHRIACSTDSLIHFAWEFFWYMFLLTRPINKHFPTKLLKEYFFPNSKSN